MTFTQLGLDGLRFFLAGEHGSRLLELLLAHTMSVALADDQADERPVILPPDTVQAVGFAPEEALFPWPARSFSGFRLLSEYFAAREKFLFIDICRLDAKTLVAAGNRMDIFLYLDRTIPDLERAVQAEQLRRWAARLSSTCSSRSAIRSARPHEHRVSDRARCSTARRLGDLVGRAGARKPAGR